MTITFHVTEKTVLVAVRQFLLAALLPGTEVLRADGNRVPAARTADFALMSVSGRKFLGPTRSSFDDTQPQGLRTVTSPTEFQIQIRVHGPSAGLNAQAVSQLFVDDVGVRSLGLVSHDLSPLGVTDISRQVMVDEQKQAQEVWSLSLWLQADLSLSVPQDFASQLAVDVVDVVAVYALI